MTCLVVIASAIFVILLSEVNGLSNLDEISKTTSCKGKCGTFQQDPCSCDSRCVVYRTCCKDFASVCPQLSDLANRKYERYLNLDLECCPHSGRLVISSCREQKNSTFYDVLWETNSWGFINDSLVMDIYNDLVYKNLKIFACNNWKLKLQIVWNLNSHDGKIPEVVMCERVNGDLATSSKLLLNKRIHTNQTCTVKGEKNQDQGMKTAIPLQISLHVQPLYIGNAHDHIDELKYKEMGDACSFLDFDKIYQTVSSDYALFSYSYPLFTMKYIYVNEDRLHAWDTLICNTTLIAGDNFCNWTIASCNTKAGFVFKNDACMRQYSYNFMLPVSQWFHELQQFPSVPHLMYCLLKHHFKLDVLDEWLPPREVNHPRFNSSILALHFIINLFEREISFYNRELKANLEKIPHLIKMYYELKYEKHLHSKCLVSDWNLGEQSNSMNNNTNVSPTQATHFICFKEKPLVVYSEKDMKFIFDFEITDLRCFYEKKSNDALILLSRPDMAACLNNCNNIRDSLTFLAYLLFVYTTCV